MHLFIYLFIYLFLGPHPQHMVVPRLEVESELQLLAYTTATTTRDLSHVCDLHYSSWPCWILNPWERPGIGPVSSWMLVRFVSAEPRQEHLKMHLLNQIALINILTETPSLSRALEIKAERCHSHRGLKILYPSRGNSTGKAISKKRYN